MSIKYFADTDTALIKFSDQPPSETRELNENIYLDLDAVVQLPLGSLHHAPRASPSTLVIRGIGTGSLSIKLRS